MTLDEAIKHCNEIAEVHAVLRKRYDDASGYSRSHNESIRTDDAKKHDKCNQDFIQLAGWLRELKALKAEPCDDAISRQAAVETILIKLPNFCGGEGGNLVDRNQAASAIRSLPSVTPKQKTGKWNVLGRDDPDCVLHRCSECHMKITLKFNYCPNCGAKMESEE